jgi:hypothetical protein
MNQDNGQIGSQPLGSEESARLRAGRERAAEWARARSNEASQWARQRGTEASDWARDRLAAVQGRVEADPQRATLWALGAGFVFGILVASLIRGGRTSDFE